MCSSYAASKKIHSLFSTQFVGFSHSVPVQQKKNQCGSLVQLSHGQKFAIYAKIVYYIRLAAQVHKGVFSGFEAKRFEFSTAKDPNRRQFFVNSFDLDRAICKKETIFYHSR